MEHGKKQATITGSGDGKTPILAREKASTAGQSKPPQMPTSIELPNTGNGKPVSVQEALSILQTTCLDLRALKCKTAIISKDNNRLFFVVEIPASIGEADFIDGHVTINGVPVVKG